jgi:RES domain-containing protein
MLSSPQLNAVLPRLTTIIIEGTGFRSIRTEFAQDPLSAIGSFICGGRYNLKEQFEALYLANNELTANLEVRALFQISSELIQLQGPPRIMLEIEYRLESVLDLTNSAIQQALGTNLQELTGLWRPMQAENQQAPTQLLGAAAYNIQTIEALKVPSAVAIEENPQAYNLVIFPDRLNPNSFVRPI